MLDLFALEQAEQCFGEGMKFICQGDYEKAAACFTRGLDFNPVHLRMRAVLGALYTASCYGLQDYGAAFEQFRVAAAQGSVDAEAVLAAMYLDGQGVAKDHQMALFWRDKAARHGHSLSQWWLGHMYEEGVGVDQDLQKAIFWYQQAAAQGDVAPTEIVTDLQKRILVFCPRNTRT